MESEPEPIYFIDNKKGKLLLILRHFPKINEKEDTVDFGGFSIIIEDKNKTISFDLEVEEALYIAFLLKKAIAESDNIAREIFHNMKFKKIYQKEREDDPSFT